MASTDLVLSHHELIENPTARVPICLVLDASPSMEETHYGDRQTPIEALNIGVQAFYEDISKDEMARYAADIAIVTFSDVSRIDTDFGSVERGAPMVSIHGGGGTSIGSGVELALDILERRKKQYKETGVDYYQPWLVLMTDGAPTDQTHHGAGRKVSDMVRQKKLIIFPIGVGSKADMQTLELFSPTRPPLRLQGLCFAEFFKWLSSSVAATSRSTPGEAVKLDVEGIKGWAEL
ncbi:VWA domain-containing protein [Skermanella sp. TT6]|uniref:VWA domain-containing protein n=1 Tax=Skermanella cutis TaxID=2775420 RepID=A0ABX7B605_9PROT|nr:VWA domain-containing protein [Skermanella sp. TT6]QQP88545.1 VWA domain-containing protein [Skermanella sp. TT6]